MAKKLSKLEIIDRLNKIDWIEFNEEDIIDNTTHFTVKCKKCGNIYLTTPANLFSGSGCKLCYLKRHSGDEHNIFDKIKSMYKSIIDFSDSEYKNIRTPILCKCKICGENFYLDTFHCTKTIIKHPCPHCRKEQERLEYQQQVIDLITKKFNGNLDCHNVYVINAKTPIKLKCNTCGTEFEATPDGLLNHKGCFIGCPTCAEKSRRKNKTKTTEQFIKQAKLLYGDTYDYSETIYKSDRSPLKIICKEPGHGVFYTLAHYHLAKYGGTCPKCKCSSGELVIMNILEKLKIPYIYLFRIKSNEFQTNKSHVDIDFCISKYSKPMFIEYNGIQHYVPVEHFGGELKFEKLINRDIEVKEYCKNHSIPLLIIPYSTSNKDIESLIK